jgi:hypothetical protein
MANSTCTTSTPNGEAWPAQHHQRGERRQQQQRGQVVVGQRQAAGQSGQLQVAATGRPRRRVPRQRAGDHHRAQQRLQRVHLGPHRLAPRRPAEGIGQRDAGGHGRPRRGAELRRDPADQPARRDRHDQRGGGCRQGRGQVDPEGQIAERQVTERAADQRRQRVARRVGHAELDRRGGKLRRIEEPHRRRRRPGVQRGDRDEQRGVGPAGAPPRVALAWRGSCRCHRVSVHSPPAPTP